MATGTEQGPVYKHRPDRGARFRRLLGSVLDPRAWLHLLKIINYYNVTHAAPARSIGRGKTLNLSPTASLANPQNIILGDRVRIGANVSLWAGPARGRIQIGDDTMIAPNAMLTAANYRFNDGSPINDQAMDEADIIVGRDVWIGAGAILLPGTEIGDGAIIGAGAMVRGKVPAGDILAAPAGTRIGRRHGAFSGSCHATGTDTDGPQSRQPDPDVLALLRKELGAQGIDPTVPVTESGIDSFGLMILRMQIETQIGRQIPDRVWAGIQQLEDIAYLPDLAGSGRIDSEETLPSAASEQGVQIPGHARREFVVNMPQMAQAGLAESWLFKEIGDLHWQLITDFLGTSSRNIRDAEGNRLYATFTRIRLDMPDSLRSVRENDPLVLDSRLERYGGSVFFGHHRIGENGRALTMSTFARYGERGNNTSLMKGTPVIPDPDAVPSLDSFPEAGVEYRTRRAEMPSETIFECDYEIQPPHDLNGVGLLYFAAYPTIFDLCLERAERETTGRRLLLDTSTQSKDLLYFANSEPDERLLFRLHKREEDAEAIRHHASLYRGSDGKRIAEVRSVKAKVGPMPKGE